MPSNIQGDVQLTNFNLFASDGTPACLHLVVPAPARFMFQYFRFDFGITAWTVLLIKSRGADGVSTVYEYLAQHSEVLGILVACVAFGGIIGGILGGKVSHFPSLDVLSCTLGVGVGVGVGDTRALRLSESDTIL